MASESPVKLKAFLIGPFGDRDDPHGSPRRIIYEEAVQLLEEVIEPSCTALGLEILRADQITRTGEIPEQVFRQLRDAHVVIADLTGANPNVMYELGLRHTTGKLTIQLGERERLPFDIAAIRTILFKRTASGLVEARRFLIQALANGLQSGGDPVAATRVWFEIEAVPTTAATASSDDYIEIDNELPGFLEKLADIEEGTQALGKALTTATAISEEVSNIFSEGAAKLSKLDASHGASATKLAIANRVATLLENPAIRLKVAAGEYSQSVDRIEPGISYLLDRLANEPEQLAESSDFPSQILMLINAAATSINGTMTFKKNIDGMGDATRSLRKVAKTLSLALQLLADTSNRIAQWRTLIDKIPQKTVLPNSEPGR